MVRREAAIQRAAVRWVKDTYPAILIASNNNEHARHAVDMGVDVGSPDLLLSRRDDAQNITHFLYVELKTSKGKLSTPQKRWSERFDTRYKSNNCTRAVAYGFKHFREIVEAWV